MGYTGTTELVSVPERLLGGVLYAAIGAYLTLAVVLVSATVGLIVSKLVVAWIA